MIICGWSLNQIIVLFVPAPFLRRETTALYHFLTLSLLRNDELLDLFLYPRNSFGWKNDWMKVENLTPSPSFCRKIEKGYRQWTHVWDSWTDVFKSKGKTFKNFLRLNHTTYINETNSLWSHFHSSITENYFRFLN